MWLLTHNLVKESIKEVKMYRTLKIEGNNQDVNACIEKLLEVAKNFSVDVME